MSPRSLSPAVLPAIAPALAPAPQADAQALEPRKPSLFDLAGEAFHLEARITEAAEGLVSDDPEVVAASTAQLEALLAAAEGNSKELLLKADAYCWVIDKIRVKATARAEHAQRLAALAKADEKRAQALQDKLIQQLLFLEPDATQFSLGAHELRSRRSTVVEVDDDVDLLELPKEAVTVRTVRSANKTVLLQLLKQGEEVEGARIVERRNWKIQ